MNDAGLFDPIIRVLVRAVGRDPVKIAVGTTAIATIAHLDGAGASTFMVTVPAMLPLYRRLGMGPLTLTCTTALAAGTTNILPWGGPTARAASALQVSTNDLFLPVFPAMLTGLVVVFVCAVRLRTTSSARGSGDVAGIAPAVTTIAAAHGTALVLNFAADRGHAGGALRPAPAAGDCVHRRVRGRAARQLSRSSSATRTYHRARQRRDDDGHDNLCGGRRLPES